MRICVWIGQKVFELIFDPNFDTVANKQLVLGSLVTGCLDQNTRILSGFIYVVSRAESVKALIPTFEFSCASSC